MKFTEGLSDSRGILHWLVATAMATLAALALVWFHANSTTAGMVFLALVVWSATQAGLTLSLYIAALCAIFFDFFFMLPYHTMRLAGAQQWVEMLTFAASCLVVSRVAERARQQTRHAEQRRKDVERLYELSQELMLYEDAEGLIRELPRLIDRIFSLDGVALYVCDRDKFYASTTELPMSIHASLRAMTQGYNPTLTIPGNLTARPLLLGMRPVGAIAWRPENLSREVATAISAQVATAIARWIAIEASARAEAARAGERLRTALTDSLTHELRTPLTSIRAAATTLLESGGLDEAGRQDMVAIIDEEATRLDLLIGEAVEMAEIDANVVEVKPAPHHPRALLEEAAENSRKALAGHRITITADDPEETELSAWFDPHLLSRVLRHLLENAATYTPPGCRVTLSSRRVGDRLEFRVEDDGPGIDAKDLPLIFEKFYRGKQKANTRKGSGMGLAITRAILAAHGGGIEASNAPGKGATFRFWVPLVEKEPESSAEQASASQA
ncbi:MAG TPA: ATP-binding protein [Terracidiphilus sp.]|nr:ATP-binding protein [Terracidiphilus sp.]